MPFINDDFLLARVVAVLKKQGITALPEYWRGPVASANQKAYVEILQAFDSRGYSKAQTDQWPAGPVYNEHLGLFFAIVAGGMLENYDLTFAKIFDDREELKTVQVSTRADLLAGRDTVPVNPRCTTGPPVFSGVPDCFNDLPRW